MAKNLVSLFSKLDSQKWFTVAFEYILAYLVLTSQFQNPLDSRGKRDKNSTRFVFYCWKSINRIVGAKDFRCFVMRNLNFLPHISKPANGNVRPYVPKIRHYSRATAGLRILLKSIPNKEEQSLSLALSV